MPSHAWPSSLSVMMGSIDASDPRSNPRRLTRGPAGCESSTTTSFSSTNSSFSPFSSTTICISPPPSGSGVCTSGST
jgi:hypothetical protein